MSVGAVSLQHPRALRRDRDWLWAAAGSALLVGLFLWDATLEARGLGSRPAGELPECARLAIESAAFFWAARRLDLEPRLRLALGLLGSLSLISASFNLAPFLGLQAGLPAIPPAVDGFWTIGSYVVGIAIIPLIPMSALRRGEWWTFLLDTVVSAGGFATVVWVLRTGPELARSHEPILESQPFFGFACSVATLLLLNLLTLRRRAIPSTRAFWWFVAGQAAYLPVTLISCFGSGNPVASAWIGAFYFVGVIPTLVAAWTMRRDPILPLENATTPHWFRSFNPFAITMPAVAAGALAYAVESGPAAAVWPLAMATSAISTLLVLRLGLTIRDNDRQIRIAAELGARAQAERLEALQLAAGGVAHVFNNTLTTVIGHAELGRERSQPGEARQSFEQIRTEAERSAVIARHLLWFTGHQFQRRDRLVADDWLRSLDPEMRALAGESVRLTLELAAPATCVHADSEQLHDALFELIHNAVEAMPGGGELLVRSDRAEAPGASSRRSAPARGAGWRLTVRDTGRGIDPEHLPHVFEPFFGSRNLAEASGLGLSMVHGVAHAHGGQVRVMSVPGRGSEFQILLPVAETDEPRRGEHPSRHSMAR